ncbi:MAG: hypothetical protein C0485_09770 [Pirellula sp.]|nr:hypothetical protein [Pirellula sp.]
MIHAELVGGATPRRSRGLNGIAFLKRRLGCELVRTIRITGPRRAEWTRATLFSGPGRLVFEPIGRPNSGHAHPPNQTEVVGPPTGALAPLLVGA